MASIIDSWTDLFHLETHFSSRSLFKLWQRNSNSAQFTTGSKIPERSESKQMKKEPNKTWMGNPH